MFFSLCQGGILSAHAGQHNAYQGGKSFASSLLGQTKEAAASTSPSLVPRFQTAQPKEASLGIATIGDAALAESQVNEVSQHLRTQAKNRQHFKIDPDTDPLFVTANQALKNPQRSLNEEFTEASASGSDLEEIKTCEAPGDETLETGEEFRVVTVKNVKHVSYIEGFSHGWHGGLSRNVITGAKLDSSKPSNETRNYSARTILSNPLPSHLQGRVQAVGVAPGYQLPPNVSLSSSGVLSIHTGRAAKGWFDKNVWWYIPQFTIGIEIICAPGANDITDTIHHNFQHLEDRVDQGLCAYEGIFNIEGPQTRIINGHPVTKDWWRRKKVFRCHYPCQDDCAPLRAKGCYQVNSACKQKVGDVCVVWQQTYKCPSSKKAGKTYMPSNKSSPFCLTGNCADTSYEANQELLNVMAHLYALREAQKDLKASAAIFRGKHRECTRHFLNFKDCCGPKGGWGVSCRLVKCDKDEDELRELRNKNLCVQVGTYCAERALGVCIRKKTSFCCYGTKMARLIQEQGRGQLGLGFGDARSPDCGGLSPEQLSRIDFSQINFSEVFEEIYKSAVPKGQGQSLAAISAGRLQDNMAVLAKPPTNEQSAKEHQKLRERGF